MTDEAYHQTRFAHDPRRNLLWQTLVNTCFQKHILPNHTVLDLGAGYGEFINHVKARKKYAIDLWQGMLEHLKADVEGHVKSVTDLDWLEDKSIDFAFSSNCFEHVTQKDLITCLDSLRAKMKPGARLCLVQPNYKYAYREYFDDYTHVSVYTDISLSDLLESRGFKVIQREPRFLPLTIKSRLPVQPWLIRLYLQSPIRPLAKQMCLHALNP